LGQTDDVEVVDYEGRVAQVHADGVGVAAVRVQRDDADAGQPLRALPGEPVGDRAGGAVGHHVEQPAGGGVDQP